VFEVKKARNPGELEKWARLAREQIAAKQYGKDLLF